MRSTIVAVVVLVLCGCDEKPKAKTLTTAELASLKPGPVRGKLTSEQIKRITRMHEVFAEVDPTPLAEVLENFSRDLNPDSEIAIWEAMATAYGGFVTEHTLTPEGRREAYGLVLVRSAASAEEVLKEPLKVLSRDEARDLLKRYAAPPAPIRVTE